ncbi:MAG TPA: ABC transporter permease subunit [Pirellulales bacterium]
MGIDRAHYHGWEGKLRWPLLGCVALVRVALVQVFRRKSYWFVIALCLVQFLFFFAAIYAITQATVPVQTQQNILRTFGFSAEGPSGEESGYTRFMGRQSLVVMILLAFSGSLLVGSDFRNKSLPFYLSRRIDRRHYILGKLLAVSVLVSLLTTLPAVVLYVEFGLFTGSIDYWLNDWRSLVAVLVYGLVLCVTLSIMLVTLSAYLQRMAPIAITWCSLFLLLRRLASYLANETGYPAWLLLDPWHDIHAAGQLCFARHAVSVEPQLGWWSLAILASVCTLCLAALVHRVRAVDIVQ